MAQSHSLFQAFAVAAHTYVPYASLRPGSARKLTRAASVAVTQLKIVLTLLANNNLEGSDCTEMDADAAEPTIEDAVMSRYLECVRLVVLADRFGSDLTVRSRDIRLDGFVFDSNRFRAGDQELEDGVPQLRRQLEQSTSVSVCLNGCGGTAGHRCCVRSRRVSHGLSQD